MSSERDAVRSRDLFLSPTLTAERAVAYLASRGFHDPAAADAHLQSMADDLAVREALGRIADELLRVLLQTPDPDGALVAFSRYLATRSSKSAFLRYLNDDPRALSLLVQVQGASPLLGEILVRNPEYFYWLLPQIDRSTPDAEAYVREIDHLLATVDDLAAALDVLRRVKRREILGIAARDVLGRETLQSATARLSGLADVLLQHALALAAAPTCDAAGLDRLPGMFAVIGMGKLGGRELNYSSDIDLLYVYDPDDPDDPKAHETFQKLARRLTAALADHTAESYLYRVDLRLRPMGSSGNLAYSIQQYRDYYDAWGETFERFALIKARPVAGDAALGARFMALVEPFVFRRYLDHAALEEMARYKARVDRTARQHDAERDVKIGRGGIREVELFTQVLQLIYGARHAALRESNTLTALTALRQGGFVDEETRAALAGAYVFLRTVEHRLQLVQEVQTHRLATAEPELERCARRLGFATFAQLEAELKARRDRVHALYATLFDPLKESSHFRTRWFYRLLSGDLSDEEALEGVRGYELEDPAGALRLLKALDEAPSLLHARSAVRNITANLLPMLMDDLRARAQPQTVLMRFEQLATQTGAASALFRTLLENDDFRRALLDVLDAGDLMALRLVRYPELLDYLAALPATAFTAGPRSARPSDNARPTLGDAMDDVRRFKAQEEFKIVFEWLSDGSLETLQVKLSALADRAVETAARWHRMHDDAAGIPDDWAILALGRLGGCELTVHSDLDLVFIYRGDPKDAQTFLRFQEAVQSIQTFLSEPTGHGVAYRVDTRLRPEGSMGSPALPISSLQPYLQTRADIWERLAWTRARFISGSPPLAEQAAQIVQRFVYGPWDVRAPTYMDDLRVRMERELAHESEGTRLSFKVGRGGLADIDFLLQLIQIREGHERPEFRLGGTRRLLSDLPDTQFLIRDEVEPLRRAYQFLQKVELVARLEADADVTWISTSPRDVAPLGRRLGLPAPAGEALLSRYRTITDSVRAIYRRGIERLCDT